MRTYWSQSPNRFVAWVIAAPAGKRGGNLGGFRQLRIAAPALRAVWGAVRCCTGVEWSARPAWRHCPIPVRPRNAGCDNGPLMAGACAGAESGAGIRFSNGACGVGDPKRVVGSLALMWRAGFPPEPCGAYAGTASPKASTARRFFKRVMTNLLPYVGDGVMRSC